MRDGVSRGRHRQPARLPRRTQRPVNAQILAVSEDKIAGFVPGTVPGNRAAERGRTADGARADPRHAARRDDPPRAPDAPGHQSGFRRARRVETCRRNGWKPRSTSCSRKTRSAATSSCVRPTATPPVPNTNSGPRSRPRAGIRWRNMPSCWPGTSGAEHFRLMPAKGIFVLGVGHVRRKTLEPGARADAAAQITKVEAARTRRTRMARAAGAQARTDAGGNP